MAGVTISRRVALDVLLALRRGELVDRALDRLGDTLEPRDRAWVQELVYGTLRLRGRIDHLLAAFTRSGLQSLDPIVLDVLRLGAYQILEMGSVPPYAAVSQSVELARAVGAGRAAGLVNGVLQALGRGWRDVAFPSFSADPDGYLVTWGSHPRWLVERWITRWGIEGARRLIEANNRRPALYLTPVGMNVSRALEQLAEAGVVAEVVPDFPDSLKVLPPHAPAEVLAIVPAVVQDPAAAMVVRYANPAEGETIVDLSAAPGGKAVGLAGRRAYVAAADLSLGRVRRIRSNAERADVSFRIGIVVADGRYPPFRTVDAVLLDAPCTGTGTLRRHPDGRWRLTETDLAALVRLQQDLLDRAATLVKPGGRLIYSTCSLEPEENELQVERLLGLRPDFQLEAPGTTIDETMLNDGFLTVLPQRHGVDGAFAACLRRAA
jgi:16S rRNA (cytosine967-C5)-methyltransferase